MYQYAFAVLCRFPGSVVALNNKNTVFAIFHDNAATRGLNYRICLVNSRMEITWCKAKEKVQSRSLVFIVDINKTI